jgi:hypothetical protein
MDYKDTPMSDDIVQQLKGYADAGVATPPETASRAAECISSMRVEIKKLYKIMQERAEWAREDADRSATHE